MIVTLQGRTTLHRSLLVASLVLSMAAAAASQDEDVISVDSTLVVLNATVRDKNARHVSGLKQTNFSIFENGVEQPIVTFGAEETPFAAVILIDSSGSMGTNVSLARSAAIKFLDGLRPDDQVAIYRFDSKVALVQDFSASRDVSEKIFDIRSYGMTVLYDAIYKAAQELDKRPERRRAIIVLSDGADTQSGRSSDRALRAAMSANAVIYTVDMSLRTESAASIRQNRGVLENFAERSGGRFVESPGGFEMRDAFESIVNELGVLYTLGYEPLNDKKDGKWRALELRVNRPGLTIRTRKGYTAEKAR
ncbi:MAG: VWA domain-containing protein [Blastocatellia bacterium]|nr:VWA domain-containing protein [Blastocatellia bacterium]